MRRLSSDFSPFIGMLEPMYGSLKARGRDMEMTLRELKRYHSPLGLIRRAVGKIQERRVLHTLTTLPRIAYAITADVKTKTERFRGLRERQLTYVQDINAKLETLVAESDEKNATPLPPILPFRPRPSAPQNCKHYAAFLEQFPHASSERIGHQVREEALHDYEAFRHEGMGYLVCCGYVHEQLEIISDAMERRSTHLAHLVDAQSELIVAGRDLFSVRRGLSTIIGAGSQVTATVRDSYGRLHTILHDLKHPERLLTDQR